MAFVIRNANVVLDGVNVSNAITEVSVEMKADDVDTTAMGAGGKQRLAGIRDDKFTFTGLTSFGANTLDAVISPKFVAAGTLEVIVYTNGSTASTAAPRWIGYCPLLTYSPLSGKVGDAAMTPLELPVSGTITQATS